jgi:hypothetical protein
MKNLKFPQFLIFATAMLFSKMLLSQISITPSTTSVTENFSTLGVVSGTPFNTVMPTGWSFIETGTNADATYNAGNGNTNQGNTWSYGVNGTSERALGGLLTGTLVPLNGVCFTNNSGKTITGFTISYQGETWRIGTAGRKDSLNFQYNANTTAINGAGTWTSVPALGYANISAAAIASGSLLHSATLTSNISGLSILNGLILTQLARMTAQQSMILSCQISLLLVLTYQMLQTTFQLSIVLVQTAS